jgi:hypothetical protein
MLGKVIDGLYGPQAGCKWVAGDVFHDLDREQCVPGNFNVDHLTRHKLGREIQWFGIGGQNLGRVVAGEAMRTASLVGHPNPVYVSLTVYL